MMMERIDTASDREENEAARSAAAAELSCCCCLQSQCGKTKTGASPSRTLFPSLSLLRFLPLYAKTEAAGSGNYGKEDSAPMGGQRRLGGELSKPKTIGLESTQKQFQQLARGKFLCACFHATKMASQRFIRTPSLLLLLLRWRPQRCCRFWAHKFLSLSLLPSLMHRRSLALPRLSLSLPPSHWQQREPICR